jgi:hypothetical protein
LRSPMSSKPRTRSSRPEDSRNPTPRDPGHPKASTEPRAVQSCRIGAAWSAARTELAIGRRFIQPCRP